MFCPLYLPSTWVSPDWCPMTSSDWANGGWWFYGPFFGHAVVSGLWGELVLFKEMGMKFQYKIVLQGFREGYYDHGFAIAIWYLIYDVLPDSYLKRLSALMGSKAHYRSSETRSFPGREKFSVLIVWTLCQKAIGGEKEGLILLLGWLGVFSLLVGGWWWYGAETLV